MSGNCRPSLRRKTLHNVRLISSLSNTDKKCIESAFVKLQQLDELGLTADKIVELLKFKEYFDSLYGQGLAIANWHLNGELEPFDNFYESALEESEVQENDR